MNETPQAVQEPEQRPVQSAPHPPTPTAPGMRITPPAEAPVKQPLWGAKRKPAEFAAETVPFAPLDNAQISSDNIMINLPSGIKAQKEKKPMISSMFGSKKEPKPKPETKEKGGLFGKKKPPNIVQLAGAAAQPEQPGQQSIHQPSYQPNVSVTHEADELTQLHIEENQCAKFRYVGSDGHPWTIDVSVAEGGVFTIGRFDASIGTKQSNFEFDKKTKAVSRRHAAIERSANGYSVVDLNSSAGTFINGQKMPPNTPFTLQNGSRVSFGNLGADYVWEE